MKRVLYFVVTMAFVFCSVLPFTTNALVPPLLQFGGWPVETIPCTCSIATWAWFAPLYLSPVPVTGPLVYYPAGTYVMANYLPTVPGVPHLGAYVPGVQACWMYAVTGCFPLPSVGVMGFVGTGLPGGK